MKIIVVLLFLAVISILIIRKKSVTAQPLQSIDDGTQAHSQLDSFYLEMRSMALNTSADDLQLEYPSNSLQVYGVVMDINMGEGIGTLVAFLSGDASLYYSTGGAIIGGFEHPTVKAATKQFVSKVQTKARPATETDLTRLPESGEVTFYFLTGKGKRRLSEKLQNIEHGKTPVSDLFDAANEVITELRLISESKK
ncbi:MAG: hypothetical protein EOP56_15220 [Sphingobacteriales bacterium]|nr:MAG: hypothetical protein EOP56_15220 [Sphingobacteriales bacterium]